MITEKMPLRNLNDVRQLAREVVERRKGDNEASEVVMLQAILMHIPSWGCTKADLDWDRIEKQAFTILNKQKSSLL